MRTLEHFTVGGSTENINISNIDDLAYGGTYGVKLLVGFKPLDRI